MMKDVVRLVSSILAVYAPTGANPAETAPAAERSDRERQAALLLPGLSPTSLKEKGKNR